MTEMPVEQAFAMRFAQLRDAAGLTQSALAGTRYTVSYISQIESGRRVPSDEALAFFAGQLGVSPDYLETGVPDGLDERLGYRIEEGRSLLRAGDPTSAFDAANEVRDEAVLYGRAHLRAQALVLAADALAILGRTREAIDNYEEGIEEGLTARERGLAVAALATAYRSAGDLSYAIGLVESSLKDVTEAPLDSGVSAQLHGVLLSLYFERGDITKAERVAQQALAAASEGVSPQTRANVLWAASRVLAEAKRWDEALELARESRVIIEGLNDLIRLARVHTAYAYLCLETDPPRLDEARDNLAEAETLLGPDGPPHERAYVYIQQARLALLSGRADEALERGENALTNMGDDPLQRGSCLFVRGRARTELGRDAEALDDFYEAAGVFEKIGARQQVANCYREVGELQFRANDLEAAIESLRSGLEALDPRRSRP